MKTYRIELKTRVGDIHFGMKREDIRQNLGAYKEFKKSKISQNTTDDFGICHIYYDMQNLVDAIEFFPNNDVRLILNSVSIFEREYDEIKKYITEIDADVEIRLDGLVSKNGISIYVESERIQTVLLTSEKYWK